MHWSEFQDAANRLAQGATEGDWRSAMSRSYYALFHYFREFLLAHGLNVGQGGESHFNLYSGLMNCGFPSVQAIASQLDRLRGLRVWADYNLRRRVGQAVAQSNVQLAQQVLADFQALLPAVQGPQIADGVRRYLQSIGRLGKTP